jgi:hypothetical protein
MHGASPSRVAPAWSLRRTDRDASWHLLKASTEIARVVNVLWEDLAVFVLPHRPTPEAGRAALERSRAALQVIDEAEDPNGDDAEGV